MFSYHRRSCCMWIPPTLVLCQGQCKSSASVPITHAADLKPPEERCHSFILRDWIKDTFQGTVGPWHLLSLSNTTPEWFSNVFSPWRFSPRVILFFPWLGVMLLRTFYVYSSIRRNPWASYYVSGPVLSTDASLVNVIDTALCFVPSWWRQRPRLPRNSLHESARAR